MRALDRLRRLDRPAGALEADRDEGERAYGLRDRHEILEWNAAGRKRHAGSIGTRSSLTTGTRTSALGSTSHSSLNPRGRLNRPHARP